MYVHVLRPNIVPVDIEKPLYEKISKIAFARNIPIKKYVNEMLMMNLEKDEFLKFYAPYLSKVGLQDNILLLKDSKSNIYVEISLKNNTLFCSAHESTDCIHVHFALALPEIVKLKIKA